MLDNIIFATACIICLSLAGIIGVGSTQYAKTVNCDFPHVASYKPELCK